MSKRFRYLITIFWAILIFVLLVIPLPRTEDIGVSYFDKIVHAILFGVFTFLLYYSFCERKQKNKILLVSILAGVIYSILGEILQLFLLARSASWLDVLAGIFGILIAALIILRITRFGK